MSTHIPRTFSDEQVGRILAACKARMDRPETVRKRAIIETLLRAGLRVNELCELRGDHVHLHDGDYPFLEVRKAKGGKQRRVPIGPRLVRALEAWEAVRPQSEWYFCSVRGSIAGRKMKTNNLRRLTAALGAKAGVEGCHPHRFRHTYATGLLANGMSTREVQTLLGHSSVATTEVYTHVDQTKLAGRVRELEEKIAPEETQAEVRATLEDVRALLREVRAAQGA